jgi:hypothetical protein
MIARESVQLHRRVCKLERNRDGCKDCGDAAESLERWHSGIDVERKASA